MPKLGILLICEFKKRYADKPLQFLIPYMLQFWDMFEYLLYIFREQITSSYHAFCKCKQKRTSFVG